MQNILAPTTFWAGKKLIKQFSPAEPFLSFEIQHYKEIMFKYCKISPLVVPKITISK